ncbi:MAG: hypothetical protein E7653_00700 [Ruminococcaceae bacterium]|nr:hypothetical protein [Oscillospiraceae bacterium]
MKRRAKKSVNEKNNVVGVSFIIFLLDKLANAIYNALINGVFGQAFTAYNRELIAYNEGHVSAYFRGTVKSRHFFRRVREYVSCNFENSFFLTKLRKGVCSLAHVPLKIYGRFFLSFGIYTLLVYFIRTLLPILGTANDDYLFIGLAVCCITAPLHFSRVTLAKAVRYGKITSTIFVDCFGYRDESFEKTVEIKNSSSGIAILLGLFAGVATFFVHPWAILAALISFAFVALIVNTPEIGILISIFSLPFLAIVDHPTLCLAVLVLTTSISYAIKLIRGKRVLKFELIDIMVLVFAILVFLAGAITVGGRASYNSALLSCAMMLIYFLIKNLIRTEKWLRRCVLAFVGSGTVIAAYGVIQYVLGFAVDDWLDTTYFTNIYGRATSVFDNPNYLAAYLCAVFPFALYCAINRETTKERSLYSWASVLIVACIVFTWSRAAWIAVIVCSIVFFMIRSRKTVRYIIGVLCTIPFLIFIIPDNILTRFMSIGDLADSSTLYRVYTWIGSIKMIKDNLLGGIGYGTEAFAEVYPSYAYAGIEEAVHSHSLYLQIIISMGIGGILCFAFVAVLFAQKSFEYIKSPCNDDTRTITSAALVSVIGLLIMGVFDYIWYNYTVFFAFWMVMAIGVAAVKIGNREKEREKVSCNTDDYSAFLDIDCKR